MITYIVDDQDLATARFGVSALSETCLSLRALVRPARYPFLGRWRTSIEPRLVGVDYPLLAALVASDESTPDFLNPRPAESVTEMADELRELTRLRPQQVEADIEAIYPGGRPEALDVSGAELRDRIAEALACYWRACVRPWWPRMLATLRADIAYRAMVAATEGQQAMLRGLSDSIDWQDNEIRGWNPNGPDYESVVGGRGLVFVPTHFTPWVSYPFSPATAPYVLYPARAGVATFDGVGTEPESNEALARLIGRARARVLIDLDQPISSTDLAVRLGISVAGANQHLRSMRDAGLLHTTRHGRSVLYYRSTVGESLAGRTGVAPMSTGSTPRL